MRGFGSRSRRIHSAGLRDPVSNPCPRLSRRGQSPSSSRSGVEITPRIHVIEAPQAFYTGPQAPNVFLVTDGGEGALIDSGFGDEQSLRARLDYLQKRPEVKVRYIILTHHHFDHTSGAHRLRQAPGAQVVMHPKEDSFLRYWHTHP